MFRQPETPAVPEAYFGVWQRKLLRAPGLEDTTTRVYWLQTRHWHGDIRVPAGRPAFAGHTSLARLGTDQLLALARQQGFGGVTHVDGDLCRWLRQQDFQPPSGDNDIGRMEFETSERVFEHGVERKYFEIWERLPDSVGSEFVRIGDDSMLLGTGDYFIHLRPRPLELPIAPSLSALAADAEALRALVDFEISFGTRRGADPAGWTIDLSTLPWREGSAPV